MRPLRLEFEAFGSYPGRVEVDFTVLAQRGLFVVTGPTGTGKTTIFDAMCFALYGSMPRKGAGEARSHHADAAAETVVRFDFECDGVRYTATRSPEYERPAKRGAQMTVERAQAQLVRHLADGTTTAVATKVRAVTDECTRLLGLGAEQFQRVVLLPQGEVARFLTAGSDERAELLGTLFGGAVYDGLVAELRERAERLRRSAEGVEAALQARLDTAGQHIARLHELLQIADTPVPDTPVPDARQHLGVRLAATEEPRAALLAQADELRAVAVEAERHLQRELAAARRFDEHAAVVLRLADLEQRQGSVEAAAQQAAISAKARPVVAAHELAEQSADRLGTAQQARNTLQLELDDVCGQLGVAPAPQLTTDAAATLHLVRTEQDRRRSTLTVLDEAVAALDAAVARRDGLQGQVDHVDGELAATAERSTAARDRLAELTADPTDPEVLRTKLAGLTELVDLRARFDVLLDQLDAASRSAAAATTHHAEVLARFVGTEAPRLAAQLVDGEPCAVCGSTEHPHPAVADTVEPTSFDDVSEAAAHRDVQVAVRAGLEADLRSVGDRLGEHASVPVAELRSRCDEARAHLEAAEARRAEHLRLTAELQQLDASAAEQSTRRATFVGQLAEVEQTVSVQAAAADLARVAAEGIDPADLDRADTLVARLAALCDQAPDLDALRTAAAATALAADRALADALAASPFATVDDARGAVLAPDDEARRLEAASLHRNDLAQARGSLETLVAQGVPDERPDVDAAEQAAEQATAAADSTTATAAKATSLDDEARRALDEHDRLVAEADEARAAHDDAQRAYRVCAFGGPLRMPLRRWVLAQELDRVTAAADVHLARMTAGRYSLRRQLGITDARRSAGLELEVLDAHTGRPRSTSSLSGGEQFQASLALALGLADVVSHGGNASGRRFEALFVDEGFGSLDQDALRDAIDTLHQLQATGRMVAAITHVEAMKQELHVGIEVLRRPDGRGSTLVVNP
jgi:exonuclease SbcC